jgi:hypothetical protein
MVQLHFYLDNIDPRGIGKPLFGPVSQQTLPIPGI